MSEMKSYGLVADIGGTHARFAVVNLDRHDPAIVTPRALSTKDHPDIAAAARAYLAQMALSTPPASLVFAVAGPVNNGEIHLTNAGWNISARDLRTRLHVDDVRVVNDFEALAEAIPQLAPDQLLGIGETPVFDSRGDGTVAIIGPGTGFGVAGLVRQGGRNMALVTEGGHIAFAPGDETEIGVLRILSRKFGRVSVERILSGPGLVNLYGALAEIEGVPTEDCTPEKLTRIASENPHAFEARVFGRFCAILGSVAGDVALTMGARHGVLIAGGILPEIASVFTRSDFRKRFEDKGRMSAYTKAIPTCLILEKNAGLIGAAAMLLQGLPEAAAGARLF